MAMARPLQRSIALTREGYVQAKGRLQWPGTLTARSLVEGAARDGFTGFKGLKPGKRQA